MKTARSGSSPIPSTSRSASKLCSWRPKALRLALASRKPRCSASQTIIPAQVPRIGRPASWWARSAGSSPADSMPLAIVVLSPPGMIRLSSPARSWGVRTSVAAAPSWRRVRACASKSPWIARTPTRSSGSAVLQQGVRGRQLGDLEAGHRLAQPDRGGGDQLGVVEVGGGLDDRPGPALRVGALEDAGADEVALGAELHHQRRVGGGGDTAGAKERHRQAAGTRDLLDDLERRLMLFGGGGQLLRAQLRQALDRGGDLAHVTDRLDHVAGPHLTLGAGHRRPLAQPPQ